MDNNVAGNFIWKLGERWGAQIVTIVVEIILARLLDPEYYGTVALVTVFTSILQVFVDSGLGTALIQKKNSDDVDFSTIFWFNILISAVLYCLMYFIAPLIEAFYNIDGLKSIIRVLSLIILISGVKNIQQAYVAKHLLFKKFFFATMGGTITAAIVGISMAYLGFGVWAIVTQYLVNATVDTIVLWLSVSWRPHKLFSFERFRSLFSYGWKMLVSSLIDTTYNELRSLIIGKKYTKEDLAFYSKGLQFPKYGVENINSSMNAVLLPVLAKEQNDIYAIKQVVKKVIRTSSYIIWPLMVGLCVLSDKVVVILLTEKWLPAAVFIRILCFNQVLQPLQTTNLSVIKALGHADMHLKMEIMKKSIAISIVIVTSLISVEAIAGGAVIYAIVASVINAYPNKKLIDYSYLEQIKDILPFIILSSTMGAVVYIWGLIPIPGIIGVVSQIIVGMIFYFVFSVVFKIDTFDYCIIQMKKMIRFKIDKTDKEK